ncbi:Mur ligase family protein [Thermomicrobium sp. 4228-Ro]|uniref:Mur ligase family protein n=1 Tax=Thermomicrobium sp. 4228-Ro TaxID=2993937 RepID=UPI002248BC97|nr:Mur ligase family protein [Thermomicrobium sp. 4228-Ro]MCX2726165.1 Mur ligase family protein [Thermomicrobium sp. 4228-Ro]
MTADRNDLTTVERTFALDVTRAVDPLPLVAVTGTRGKSTTAWLLYRMLRARSLASALWSSSGVYVNDQRLPGELQPWSIVVRALAAGELDLAVQELEAPVVASVGLPEGRYALGAITTLCGNDEACLLTPESRHARRAHEIVARAVHRDGVLVLNADDPAVLGLADRSRSHVVFVALHPDNPALRRFRDRGLPALWCQDGLIIANQALVRLATSMRRLTVALRTPNEPSLGLDEAARRPAESEDVVITDVRDAPCTLGGALTFQIQNIMCASALALALGLPITTIDAVARTFLPDAQTLPGSCNILSVRGHDVLIDGARYPWALRSLIRGIRHRSPRRTLVLTHAFPWLQDGEVQEVGRLLGRLNGLIVLTEPIDDERYRLFQDGVVHNPYPPILVTQPDFEQALHYVFSLAQAGDLCLVLTAEPLRTIALLERLASD